MRAALAILCRLVACAFAAPAQASSTARFGIHDDAWLIFGPGTLEERIDRLDRLGVELVRFTVRWDQVARERPRAAALVRRSRRTGGATARTSRGAREHEIGAVVTLLGTPRVGERRPASNGPRPAVRLRRLRRRGSRPVSVGARLDDLERAEPAPLAEPRVAVASTSSGC